MELYEITDDLKTTPGEYIYHAPTMQIVLCGSFNRKNNVIRALSQGKMITDKISNFKKIKLSEAERQARAAKIKPCGGCKG